MGMNKFILAIVAALAAFASAEVIEIKCHAPEMIYKEPIYKDLKKPVIDLEKLQEEIDARNAEIAANKPEAQILDFENQSQIRRQTRRKVGKDQSQKQAKVFQK